MASLRNANGKSVIDEAEAEADAQKIEQAKAKLEEARQFLDPSKIDAERMRGETADGLQEVFSKLQRDIKTWEERCDTTAKYIRSVVKKYQRIDREYAQKIGGHYSSSGAIHGGGTKSF